tara:strand:- start:14513 stop:14632 length:120 start_codon:yes stop_codon:yes gene_type:complete
MLTDASPMLTDDRDASFIPLILQNQCIVEELDQASVSKP